MLYSANQTDAIFHNTFRVHTLVIFDISHEFPVFITAFLPVDTLWDSNVLRSYAPDVTLCSAAWLG
jgi:hypothetical protein